MTSTIVWDLDLTFWGNLCFHPDTELLLRRSRQDFGRVVLWTYNGKEKKVRDILELIGVQDMFDTIIGTDHPYYMESLRKRDDLCKDLSLIGSVEETVMIEDDGFAYPKDRGIIVPRFGGQKDHDLRLPYQCAYLLMYFPDEYKAMSEEQKLAAARELEVGYAFRDREL